MQTLVEHAVLSLSTDSVTNTNPNPNPNPNQPKRVTIGWTFEAPSQSQASSKMQLLTIGGIAVTGTWCGHLGQYYVAHAPLLPVDKKLFNSTLKAYKNATFH